MRLGFLSLGEELLASCLLCSPCRTKPRFSAEASGSHPSQRLGLLIPVGLRVPQLAGQPHSYQSPELLHSRRQPTLLFHSRTRRAVSLCASGWLPSVSVILSHGRPGHLLKKSSPSHQRGPPASFNSALPSPSLFCMTKDKLTF